MLDNRPVKVPALLDRLDAAVTEQTRAGSSGGGASSLPIGEGAYALLQDIDREARTHYFEMLAHEFRGSLRTLLKLWAKTTTTPEWESFLEHASLDWCDRILAIVEPKRPPRRLTLPCPACGVLYGEDERKPVLHLHCWADEDNMLPVGEWTAECIGCGAAWGPDEMGWLTRAIAA